MVNTKMTRDEIKKYIEENLQEHFIGAHATRIQNEDGLNAIVNNGVNLKTEGNRYGMAGTVASYGNSNDVQNIEDLTNYSYDINGVIISVPIFLEYGDKTIFLGYPGKTEKGLPKDQDDYDCLMTELFNELGEIPSCFILAHYTTDSKGNREFTLNENYYLSLDEETREKTLSEMLEKIKIQSQSFSDGLKNFTTPYNIENYSRIIKMKEEKGIPVGTNGLFRTVKLLENYRKKQITPQEIGRATINTPTTAKVRAQQVENGEITKDNVKEGEEVGDDN